MRLLGLRFILEGSHFLQLVMPENEARKIVKNWRERDPRFLEAGVLGSDTPDLCWAVRLDKIQAMHTFDPRFLESPQALPPAVSGMLGRIP